MNIVTPEYDPEKWIERITSVIHRQLILDLRRQWSLGIKPQTRVRISIGLAGYNDRPLGTLDLKLNINASREMYQRDTPPENF